jgi:hypothetical protein
VLNVTVVDTDVDPLRLTTWGETVHVEFCGAPLQLSVTFPVKPPIGVSVMLKIARCPDGMLWDAGDTDMEKSPTDSVTVTPADVLDA